MGWAVSAPLAAIYETACPRRVGRGGVLEGAETALRRRLVEVALCWVMSDAGLRRSEAAALVQDDIARWDNGSGLRPAGSVDLAPRQGGGQGGRFGGRLLWAFRAGRNGQGRRAHA